MIQLAHKLTFKALCPDTVRTSELSIRETTLASSVDESVPNIPHLPYTSYGPQVFVFQILLTSVPHNFPMPSNPMLSAWHPRVTLG